MSTAARVVIDPSINLKITILAMWGGGGGGVSQATAVYNIINVSEIIIQLNVTKCIHLQG